MKKETPIFFYYIILNRIRARVIQKIIFKKGKYFILYPNISCATVHTTDESNLYHSFEVNQDRSLQGLRVCGCSGMQPNVVNVPTSPGPDAFRYVSCRGGQKQELSCPAVS